MNTITQSHVRISEHHAERHGRNVYERKIMLEIKNNDLTNRQKCTTKCLKNHVQNAARDNK